METIHNIQSQEQEEKKRVMAKITHPVYQAIRTQKARKKRKENNEE